MDLEQTLSEIERVSPPEVSPFREIATRQCSTIATMLGGSELPATFRGDGYQIPQRRVDVAGAPLSVADTRITTGLFSEAQHQRIQQIEELHVEDDDFSKSPRVQRLLHIHQDPNELAAEFPVLLGQTSYSSNIEKRQLPSNIIAPSGYPPKCSFPNGIPPHHFVSVQNPYQISPTPYAPWGSLPLVSQTHPMSQPPTPFFLPPSPYVNDVGNVSFRPNVAASSTNNVQLLTPPTSHAQVLPPNTQPLECKVGYSVPAPQCPKLSGQECSNMLPQHTRSINSTTNTDSYFFNPSYYPYSYGATPPTHSSMKPHLNPYPQYVEEGWIGTGYYPIEHPSRTFVPLSPSYYPSSMHNTKDPMSSNTLDSEVLWNTQLYNPNGMINYNGMYNSGYYHSIPRTTIVTPPLRDIESRVAPERPTRHTKNGSHATQQSRPSTSIRRINPSWGQPLPSQEERKTKKWWMLCSSV